MIKHFVIAAALTAGIATAPVHATQTHNLRAGVTVQYEFPSQDAQEFNNFLFWTVNATCKISSEDASNELLFEALSKQGSVNNIPVKQGQTVRIFVTNGGTMELSADSGAKVRITNLGAGMVRASCTTR